MTKLRELTLRRQKAGVKISIQRIREIRTEFDDRLLTMATFAATLEAELEKEKQEVKRLDKHMKELRSMAKWWMNHHKQSNIHELEGELGRAQNKVADLQARIKQLHLDHVLKGTHLRDLETELAEAQSKVTYWKGRTVELLEECTKEKEARRGLQNMLATERGHRMDAEHYLQDAMPQIPTSHVRDMALEVGAPVERANFLAELYQEAMDKASGSYDEELSDAERQDEQEKYPDDHELVTGIGPGGHE